MCDLDNQIRKLVEILSIALRCGNLTVDQTDLTKSVHSALSKFVGGGPTTLNDSSTSVSSQNNNNNNNSGSPSILTFLSSFAKIGPHDDNSTTTGGNNIIPGFNSHRDGMVNSSNYSELYPFSSVTPTSSGEYLSTWSTTPTMSTIVSTSTPPPSGIKLHRLEIIKVVVLIVVISIILLTTCRMIFQLFLRFKPEKSNGFQ